MQPKKLNLKLLWMQFTDFLYPRLRLSLTERAVYFYLIRHTRLEGKLQLHCSMPWLARGLGISTGPVRESVRRLAVLGAVRIVQRSKAGHILEVRLPEEILATNPGLPAVAGMRAMGTDVSMDDPLNALAATLDPSINPDPLANSSPAVDLEKLDFLKTRALRNSIHLRERGHCFYCLRRTDAHTQCLDHVQPRVKAGCNSYRNLVSSCLECNSQKGEQSATDFFRALYRDRRLTASEFQAGLRRLDALTAGKLPPPVQHPDIPLGTRVGARYLVPSLPAPHPQACHSERSRPTFSSAFAPANASACGVEESLCPSSRSGHLIGRKGRPRRAFPA
jgi:HNH endonuclease